MNTQAERPLRVLAVSAAVALGCAGMVTGAVTYFRPLQSAYASADLIDDVLLAAGLRDPLEALGEREAARRFARLETRVANLETGRFVTGVDARSFDFEAAARSDAGSIELAGTNDPAKLGRREKLLPVYFLRDQERVQRIVLPVRGRGMWSEIRAFVTLGSDINTIEALVIRSQGETPGIGDRIEAPAWLASWAGRQTYDAAGKVQLKVAAAGTGPRASEIDAITGATVTVERVVTLVRFWLGEDGYAPLLRHLRGEDD